MRIKFRGRAAWVTIFAVLLVLLLLNMCSAPVSYAHDSSVTVDVFTQQEPYSGKGPNIPSDAFGPQDVVILYALVTNSDSPMGNILVGFNVRMPDNASFSLSALTNAIGIATVNFRIPPISNVSENDIFGTWRVTASVLVGGDVYQDTLSFKVDWVVKLLSVKTTGENVTDQNHFGRGGDMGLVITLRSIAMSLRNATIAIAVRDQLNVVVNSSTIQDFIVPPNEEIVTIYCKATLASNSFVGSNASVTVSAFNTYSNGTLIPYCPSISAAFSITTETPIKIAYPDAAVVVVLPSAKTIEVGEGLTLETIVRAEGTVPETFNVSTFFDQVRLGTSQVTNLSPYSAAIFHFNVSISMLTVGNHTISASIPPMPKEVNVTDNYFSSWIEVTPVPLVIHDIGIASLTVVPTNVYIGSIVDIYVTVKNNGTATENDCTLSAYYNSSLIENVEVTLTPGSQVPVTFSWNTSSVSAGLYQIKVYAALPDNETDPSPGDNTRTLSVLVRSAPSVIHDIGITNVTLSTNSTFIGGAVKIYVTVKNNGTATESFPLSVYYNSSLVETLQVNGLGPNENVTRVFSWDTIFVSAGLYRISASAPLAGDPSPGDNTFVDGFVQVKPVLLSSLLLSEVFIAFISGLAIIASLILFLMSGFGRRRRKKNPSRYAVIAHLHI
jgi:hypothetical protein